jgi:mono/diheme cytochrome c family protein
MHKLLWILAATALAMFTYADVKIKTTPVSRTSPVSGQEMFTTYCAVCHGTDAKGNGPAVPALKMAPPDLTKLSVNNGGKFPEMRVYSTIRGEADIPAHGSKDMPVWGALFRSLDRTDSSLVNLRLRNLTAFVQSLQK